MIECLIFYEFIMGTPIAEMFAQILWFIVAIWFIRSGYQANKKAPKFSLKTYKLPEGIRATVAAEGLVLGVIMLVLLALKILSCGIICWP
jgi:hypothetical protein